MIHVICSVIFLSDLYPTFLYLILLLRRSFLKMIPITSIENVYPLSLFYHILSWEPKSFVSNTTFSWSYKRRGLVLANNKHIQCPFYKLLVFQISLLNNNDKRTEKPRNYLLPKTKRFFGWSAVCRKCVQA